MTVPTTTLTRTRRRDRTGRMSGGAARVAAAVMVALARQEPVMLRLPNAGRGWWAVAADQRGVTVRRHGETVRVDSWEGVEVDG